MVPIARKNLLDDKIRLIVSIGGVTFAVILILVVRSLYEGYYRELGVFVDGLPVDLWVTQTDSGGLVYNSTVQEDLGAKIAQTPGVSRVIPMDRQRVRLNYHGRAADVIAMAFNMPQSSGPSIGLNLPSPGDITIDATTAKKCGIKVGDLLSLRGHDYRVSALTAAANLGLSGLAVVSWDDSEALLGTPGYVSSWLVNVAPDANASEVMSTIDANAPGTQAFTRQQFAHANRVQVSGTFLPIMSVLIIVSFLVGTAVVGLTIYTSVAERIREFGVLKAIGAPHRTLYRVVLQQSVIVCSAGFVIALPLTYAINRIAVHFVSEFITLLRWQDCLLAFAAVLAMALLASVVPIRRIAGIDPAEVFRA